MTDMPPFPAIRIEHLTVHFGDRLVLDIPELAIDRGRITVLFGPNGSGKSTLLHALAGLLVPSSGRIVPCDALDPLPDHTGIVLQRPVLFAGSVQTNVEYGLRCRGVPATDRALRVTRVLEWLGIDHKRHATRRKLSGGEIQRAAIARTLALEPRLLLLDEAFSHLDPEGSRVLSGVLLELREAGSTIVLATHDISGGLAIADRTVALESGRVQPHAALNAVRGVSVREHERWLFRIREGLDIEHTAAVEGRGIASIDASDITLSREIHESSARNRLRGTIISLREISGGVRVGIEIDAGVVFEAIVTVHSAREMSLGIGDTIVLTFKASSVRVSV